MARERLAPQDMIEKLKDTASHLGMDDEDSDKFVHNGMKRAGYRAIPSYVDDDNEDEDDDDDLMPSRGKHRGSSAGQHRGSKAGKRRSNPDDANSSW